MAIFLRVHDLRLARGWTQAELAERAGLHVPTISLIENRKTTGVDFATLEALARALEVDAGYLIVTER